MPVLRYFCCVGGALLALLLIANAWFPAPPASGNSNKGQTATNLSIIRIHSDQKLPDKVVFDTSQPTIVPPASTTIAAANPPTIEAPKSRVREAFAQAGPNQIQPAPSAEPRKAESKRKQRKVLAKNYNYNYMGRSTMLMAQQPRFGFFGNIW